jgi:hypothetical protein
LACTAGTLITSMAKLTLEVPDVVALRLEALAGVSGKGVEELAVEAIDALAGSPKSRRAISKARQAAAKAAGTPYSLADLGWLDGYAGQSVDEALSFEGTENPYLILGTVERAIQKKLETDGALQMTGVTLMVLSVMALAREVNNGGFDQFFRNSSRRFASRIVGDLVRIGCPEFADITQQAVDALEIQRLTVPAIDAAMAVENVKRTRMLERCDIAFYERGELTERLFAYVKLHQDGVQI